jgi:ribulose-5-phosphate 4-epimerase/fuculose-1-phosphate aldolase
MIDECSVNEVKTMSEVDDLKEKLTTAIQILRWELADMWGHVSCRTPRGDSFLLLPLRPPLDHGIPEDDVLEFDMEGKLISGQRDPPEEIFFYTCMYKAKKDAGAVIHCHPPVAVSLVATGKKIVPIHQHSIKFGKGIPTSPWLYGTWQEDGEKAAKMMANNCALMIKGHGANVTGRTIQEACLNAVHLERTAKMILWAQSVGKVSPFPAAVVKKYERVEADRVTRRGSRPPRSPEWNYYEWMIKRGERWNTW